jgi:methyl-accepting chemotaxis protein
VNTPANGVRRASERVSLACRALSAAANDLRVAHSRNSVSAVDDAADQVGAETERVCELAEELGKLAENLRHLPLQAAGRAGG